LVNNRWFSLTPLCRFVPLTNLMDMINNLNHRLA